MPEQDPIKRLVERRHPEYVKHCAEWTFLRQAIEGGPAYVEGNLFRHAKEEERVYNDRKKRACDHHYNLTAQVLDCYLGYLFQQAPTPADGLPEAAVAFLGHADRDRRPALDLARDAARWMAGLGAVWLGVDKPPAPQPAEGQPALSALQERELGLAPYAYLVLPTHVLDGRIAGGRVEWLLVQEDERDDVDPLTSTGDIRRRWRLWTAEQWTLIEEVKDGRGQTRHVVAAEGPNPVGEVPFVPLLFSGGLGFSSPSLISDIAHLDRAVFNKASLLDEIHYQATFPQLTVPHDDELWTDAGLTGAGKQILTVGLNSVLPYSAESGAPQYLSPPSGPAQELRQSIQEMVRMAMALALLEGEIAVEEGPRAGASGVSKAYSFEKLNKRLATIADTIQTAFGKVLRLVCLWQGEDPEALGPVPWDFPETFQVESLAQELEILAAAMGAGPPSATLKAELWKKAARRLVSKIEPAKLEQIDAEIEAGVQVALAGEAGQQLPDAQGGGTGEQVGGGQDAA